MKKFLYEIDTNSGWMVSGIPYMPKVLAEKTARAMTKAEYKKYGKLCVKYTVSKTTLTTKDSTPHGYKDWFEYYSSNC